MDEVIRLYKQLKANWQLSAAMDGLFDYVNTGKSIWAPDGNIFPTLQGLSTFLYEIHEAFDNLPGNAELLDMKKKVIAVISKQVHDLENHELWKGKFEPLTDDLKEKIKEVVDFPVGPFNEKLLTPTNQLLYLHCLLTDAANKLDTSEEQLPPIEASLKYAANYVVLLHTLGILDYLKTNYNIPAQRLGELCELITGQKTHYFREAFSNHDPQKSRAFTPKGRREVASELMKFGINPPDKKGRS